MLVFSIHLFSCLNVIKKFVLFVVVKPQKKTEQENEDRVIDVINVVMFEFQNQEKYWM